MSDNEQFVKAMSDGSFDKQMEDAPSLADYLTPDSEVEDQGGDPPPSDDGEFFEGEEWDTLPKSVRAEMRRRWRENEDLKEQNRTIQQQMAALTEQVTGLAKNGKEPEPEGLAKFKSDELRQYLVRSEKVIAAAASNPENEELRQEASKVNVEYLQAIRDELGERKVQGATKGILDRIEQQNAQQAFVQKAQGMMLQEVGSEALRNPNSPITRRAREIASELMEQFDIPDSDQRGLSALSVMAMRLANAEAGAPNRRRDDRAAVLRQSLDLDGQARRSSSAASERSAARKSGDVDKLIELSLREELGL